MADRYSSSSRVGLALGISAVVGLLAGCRPSPHQAALRDDASRTVIDAASPPGRSLDAGETATHVDAAAATTSPRSQTSRTSPDVWLRDHGIQTWQHDSACWAR